MTQRTTTRHRTLLLSILVAVTATACANDGRTVTGIVTGLEGAPLVRAVVYVTGTLDQTVTDDTGRFSIDLPPNHDEILIQSMGYQERPLRLDDDRDTIEVELEPRWNLDWLQAWTNQKADPNFAINTESQTFPAGEGPVITVDEGHHNAHTATGRFSFVTDILEQDGYVVARSGTAFTAENLAGVEVLMVATPLHGMEDGSLPTLLAIKDEEVTHLVDWIRGGGSLFLVSDHMPIPGAQDNLLQALGIRGLNGYAVSSQTPESSTIIFRRSDGSLGPHPVIDGLNPSERINSVASLSGFAFQAGDDFEPLFVLPDAAVSLQVDHWFTPSDDYERIPVGGWWQAALGEIGEGRVALMGEAGMFTAQIRGPDQWANGLSDPVTEENP